jgi:hypothetical protein
MPPALWALFIFQIGSWAFALSSLNPWSPCLCLPNWWDYKCEPACPALGFSLLPIWWVLSL